MMIVLSRAQAQAMELGSVTPLYNEPQRSRSSKACSWTPTISSMIRPSGNLDARALTMKRIDEEIGSFRCNHGRHPEQRCDLGFEPGVSHPASQFNSLKPVVGEGIYFDAFTCEIVRHVNLEELARAHQGRCGA